MIRQGLRTGTRVAVALVFSCLLVPVVAFAFAFVLIWAPLYMAVLGGARHAWLDGQNEFLFQLKEATKAFHSATSRLSRKRVSK